MTEEERYNAVYDFMFYKTNKCFLYCSTVDERIVILRDPLLVREGLYMGCVAYMEEEVNELVKIRDRHTETCFAKKLQKIHLIKRTMQKEGDGEFSKLIGSDNENECPCQKKQQATMF